MLQRTHFLSKSFVHQVFFRQRICLLPTRVTCIVQKRINSTNTNEVNDVEIYYGKLAPKFRIVKTISFMTSFGGIVIQPAIINQMAAAKSIILTAGVLGFINFFTFVTPILLHLLTKRYVIRIMYNSEKDIYTATVLTFFLRKKEIPFTIEDINVPEVPGLFTTFVVHNRALFVDDELFHDPTHYGRMMGYDKPVDFKLKPQETIKQDTT